MWGLESLKGLGVIFWEGLELLGPDGKSQTPSKPYFSKIERRSGSFMGSTPPPSTS